MQNEKKQAETVLSTGEWYSKRDCKKSPNGRHSFKDIERRKSSTPGESLVTSQCKHCGGLIKDCPTIGLSEFDVFGRGKAGAK